MAMKRGTLSLAVGLLLLAWGGIARADLVVNGSFETGSLAPWTDGGNLGYNLVALGANAPGHGVYGVLNGALDSFSLLSQTLATKPGETYRIDFWLWNDGFGTFHVLFDGVQVYSESNVAHPYTRHSVLGTASGDSTVLQLQTLNTPGFIQFDAFSVNAAVPEPASLGLLGLGAVALACGAARRGWRLKSSRHDLFLDQNVPPPPAPGHAVSRGLAGLLEPQRGPLCHPV
jgi:hypothetical protein